jgi:hypothetical protein
MSMEIEGD